jgi:hypothetical protein
MSVDAPPQDAPRTARIRELMLANLFAVFNERDPKRRLKVITRNYTEDVIWSGGLDGDRRQPHPRSPSSRHDAAERRRDRER